MPAELQAEAPAAQTGSPGAWHVQAASSVPLLSPRPSAHAVHVGSLTAWLAQELSQHLLILTPPALLYRKLHNDML